MSIAGDEVSITPILMKLSVVVATALIPICGYLVDGRAAALVAVTLYAFHPITLMTDIHRLADGLEMPLVLASMSCALCYVRFSQTK